MSEQARTPIVEPHLLVFYDLKTDTVILKIPCPKCQELVTQANPQRFLMWNMEGKMFHLLECPRCGHSIRELCRDCAHKILAVARSQAK